MILRRAFILLFLLQASLCADYLKILQVSHDSTSEWLELKDGQTASVLGYQVLPTMNHTIEIGNNWEDIAHDYFDFSNIENGKASLTEMGAYVLGKYRFSAPPIITLGTSVVRKLAVTSADSPSRDPVTYEVHGSNNGVNYTLLSSGAMPSF
ncbi:MAG: hypothetical protein VW879_12870, partial [Opitutae bacterium]